MLNVQKNVPIPAPTRTGSSPRRKYPFEDMSVGDMFFVPNRERNNLSTHASTVGRSLERKFITRLVHMVGSDEKGWSLAGPNDKNAVQGIGVWRTE